MRCIVNKEKVKKLIADQEAALAELRKQLQEIEEEEAREPLVYEAADGATYTVLMETWTESEYEPGWGATQRSDGAAFHINNTARDKYNCEVIARQRENGSSSDGYSLVFAPDHNTRLVQVPKKLFDVVKKKGTFRSFHVKLDGVKVVEWDKK